MSAGSLRRPVTSGKIAFMQLVGKLLDHQVSSRQDRRRCHHLGTVWHAAMALTIKGCARGPHRASRSRLARVLTLADVHALAQTVPGRYVLAHMPPSAQAQRLAGDALTGSGSPTQHGAPAGQHDSHRGRLVACGLAANIHAKRDDRNLAELQRGMTGRSP